MQMSEPGDVVTVEFPGIAETKRRPAVVVSTHLYQRTRPDVILGLLTTQITNATLPSDYALQDWEQAGLHKPSTFRTFLETVPATAMRVIGHLSERDWQGIQQCLQAALAVR